MSPNMQKIAALAALIPLVAGHGYISSPTPRKPGDAYEAACGQQPYYQQTSDINGNVQGILQVVGDDFDASACNLWLCKGFLLADSADSAVQSYTAGESVDFEINIAAPHTGYANVSVVKTSSNSIIGSPLIEFDNYASNSGVAANNTAFSVTIPDDLGSECSTAGDCVLQWFWNAPDIDQTYEGCVDFTLGGSSSGSGSSSETAAASSAVVATSAAAVSSAAAVETSVAATTPVAAVTEPAAVSTTPAANTPSAPSSTPTEAAGDDGDDEDCDDEGDDDTTDDGSDDTVDDGSDDEDCDDEGDDDTTTGDDDTTTDDGDDEDCDDDEEETTVQSQAAITQAAVVTTTEVAANTQATTTTTAAAQSGSNSSGSSNSGKNNNSGYSNQNSNQNTVSHITSYVTVTAQVQTKYVTVTADAPACT